MRRVGSLAERIIYAMEKQDISQAELSRRSGLSTSVIAQIVTGKTTDPRFDTVVMLAVGLGVSLDFLAGKEPYSYVVYGDVK